MKNIYFVRHGESDANTGGAYLGAQTPLSEKGREQVQMVAERFTRIPIDLVVTSTFDRAIQTGERIAEKTKTPMAEPNELFGEREHPNEAYGLPSSSDEYQRLRKVTWELFKEGKVYSTEESFDVLIERSKGALEYIANLEEENIAVVTHANFARFLVAWAIFDELLTPKVFVRFLERTKFSNTGITHMVLKNAEWHLYQWNDHAHLG